MRSIVPSSSRSRTGLRGSAGRTRSHDSFGREVGELRRGRHRARPAPHRCVRPASARRSAVPAARPTMRGNGACWRIGPMTGSSTVTRSPRAACGDRRRCRRRCRQSRPARRGRRTRASISVASSVAGPRGDDAVDLVAVGGPVGELRVARVGRARSGRSIALQSRGKLASRAGDDAHVLAVARRVVVERRRVREPVALAAAHDAEPVVGGQGPLEDAQRRAVERGVDDGAAYRPRASRAYSARRRGLRREHAGQVVGDRDADAHRAAGRDSR